jgi:hypothetical protein
MRTIEGPAIFLAQFLGDEAPLDALAPLARWAADLAHAACDFLRIGPPTPADRRRSPPVG